MIKKNFLLYSLFLVVVGLSVNTTLFPMNSSSDDSDDDIVGAANFLDDSSSEEDGEIKEHESFVESITSQDSEEECFTLTYLLTLKKDSFNNLTDKKKLKISHSLYSHMQKLNNSISEIKNVLQSEYVTKFEEDLKKLKNVQINRIDCNSIDLKQLAQILIPIIEHLPPIIEAIDEAIDNVNEQEKKQLNELDTISSTASFLQTKKNRLQCLRSVLKPAFVILTVGVIVGYNTGLLPATVSESVQNYVVSTFKSWFF